ncbi:hypothetical protein ACFFLS_02875 [Flavobacterium procerum]|uniref:Lipoprotein n=1 Tax=Flavobacterium procerum TaxID=1455569 RepID=A0ABV6BKK9_9FLAO
MTKKIYIAFLLLLIGFVLTPVSGYACGIHSVKKSHTKEIATEKKEKDCCTKSCCQETSKSKKKKHDCDGKCNHTNCTTPSLQLNIPSLNDFSFQNNFNFSLEKPITYYHKTNLSDGFTNIWLPPKIK